MEVIMNRKVYLVTVHDEIQWMKAAGLIPA